MEHAPIHRVSVADQVASVVRHRILTGELRPGTSLQELQLASSLGVSRNTMREAVRILCLEGLLERNLHRGLAVARLNSQDVREIYQLRRMLEIQAVLSAKSPNPSVIEELADALEKYETAVKEKAWARAVSTDLHFHSLIIRLHGNRRLESFYGKVIGELRMGMVLVDRAHDDPTGLIPTHRKICQLLTSGKLRECAAVLEQHLEDSESRLLRVLEGNPGSRGAPSRPGRAARHSRQ